MENISFINFRKLNYNICNELSLIYRSGTSYSLSEIDIKYLNSLGIKKLFDFRSRTEILNNRLYELSKIYNIEVINIPIEGYHDKFKDIMYPNEIDYSKYYMDILDCGKESFAYILNYMHEIKSPEPIVYSCNLGKDRTGVFSYILLNIFSSKYSDIEKDYEKSSEYLLNNKYLIDIYKNNKRDFECRCKTKKLTIKLMTEKIIDKYGSINGYLDLIGIDESKRKNIAHKWRNT